MRRLNDRYNRLKEMNARYVEEQEISRAIICHGLPTHITVETTNRCNLRCPHCQIHSPLYRYTYAPRHVDMEFTLFEKLAMETFPWVQRVSLTISGEAFMSKNLDPVCDLLEAYGVGLEITTNGTLLNERNIRRMLGLLRWTTVSFDGAQKETFERWRAGANFERVIKNVKTFNHLRKSLPPPLRPHLNFTYVLMRDNIEEFPAFMDLAHDLHADSVSAPHVIVSNESMRAQSLIYHKTLSNHCLEQARQRARTLGLVTFLPPPFMLAPPEPQDAPRDNRNSRVRQIDCSYLWRKSYLEINGDVVTCCVSGRPVVGNLRDQNFWDIWNGEKYRWMRASLSRSTRMACCVNCNADPYHMGRGTERAFFVPEEIANDRGERELSALMKEFQPTESLIQLESPKSGLLITNPEGPQQVP